MEAVVIINRLVCKGWSVRDGGMVAAVVTTAARCLACPSVYSSYQSAVPHPDTVLVMNSYVHISHEAAAPLLSTRIS